MPSCVTGIWLCNDQYKQSIHIFSERKCVKACIGSKMLKSLGGIIVKHATPLIILDCVGLLFLANCLSYHHWLVGCFLFCCCVTYFSAAGTHLILRLPSTTKQPLRSLSSQADLLLMSLGWCMESTGWRISDQCYLWSTMSSLLWVDGKPCRLQTLLSKPRLAKSLSR